MERVAVYCGFAGGDDPSYRHAAAALGRSIAERGLELVYGGGGHGMMRAVADGALESGGRVIGVIPAWMDKFEDGHRGLTKRIEVDSMHDRKAAMAELADGFIALPGGLGTLEETFEMLTWQQLDLHTKPIAFLDVNDFWSYLFTFLDHAATEGLLSAANRSRALRFESIDELLDVFEQWQPTHVDKWMVEHRT